LPAALLGFGKAMTPLNILHVLRAPVGGLFRHVLDLTREQIARGNRVGIVADALTGGARADAVLGELAPALALGLSRIPMHRHVHPGDIFALTHVMRRIVHAKADVVHGHGAKGGAFARLAGNTRRSVRAYTPHGGSLLFSHDTLAGRVYLTTERLLMPRGDLYLFESHFSADTFSRKIGRPRGLVRVVHNGVTPDEFKPVTVAADASDLVFLGEMRELKGVDLLIDAVALLHRDGRPATATLIGDGPDVARFHAQVERLGLSEAIRFRPPMPARAAQALGRVMVMPSRLESLPYVVLEAAASAKPLIASKVGGIAEIYGPLAGRLVRPDDAPALARAIAAALDDPQGAVAAAKQLQEQVAAGFSLKTMVDGVLAGYQAALAALAAAGRR
jgi:glycosyltransferase involved in cell wall biosynthesis